MKHRKLSLDNNSNNIILGYNSHGSVKYLTCNMTWELPLGIVAS